MEKNKADARKEYLKEYHNTEKQKNLKKDWRKSDTGKEYMKEYQKTDNYRNKNYIKNYGITLDDYNDMFTSQNGCCKICKTHQSELPRSLAVDHCHETNKVRGLLCDKCNRGLGHFNDDIDLLTKAIKYIKQQK